MEVVRERGLEFASIVSSHLLKPHSPLENNLQFTIHTHTHKQTSCNCNFYSNYVNNNSNTNNNNLNLNCSLTRCAALISKFRASQGGAAGPGQSIDPSRRPATNPSRCLHPPPLFPYTHYLCPSEWSFTYQ